MSARLLKLADFLQEGTARPAEFRGVLLQACQDTHVALRQHRFAEFVDIDLAGSIALLPYVVLCLAKRGNRHKEQRQNHYVALH
jgi:hypothetical protein